MITRMSINEAIGNFFTSEVTLTGRGDPDRAYLVCVSGTGEYCGKGKTYENGCFTITFTPPGPNPHHGYQFTVRHLEDDGTVGNNLNWSTAVNNPLEG